MFCHQEERQAPGLATPGGVGKSGLPPKRRANRDWRIRPLLTGAFLTAPPPLPSTRRDPAKPGAQRMYRVSFSSAGAWRWGSHSDSRTYPRIRYGRGLSSTVPEAPHRRQITRHITDPGLQCPLSTPSKRFTDRGGFPSANRLTGVRIPRLALKCRWDIWGHRYCGQGAWATKRWSLAPSLFLGLGRINSWGGGGPRQKARSQTRLFFRRPIFLLMV